MFTQNFIILILALALIAVTLKYRKLLRSTETKRISNLNEKLGQVTNEINILKERFSKLEVKKENKFVSSPFLN